MSSQILSYFDAGTLVIAAFGLVRLRPVVQQTTLITVWPWMWVAWTAAVVGWGLRFQGNILVTYADYFTAVAALCPPMASLGARRPTCRSWPLFVLLPMFAVLLWPAVSVGLATRFARPLELETPAVVMYIVVLIMALGNYALGRMGVLVLFFALLLAGHVSGAGQRWTGFAPEFLRFVTLWIAVFIIYGFRNLSRPDRQGAFDDPEIPEALVDPFDAILHEFGELYGLVWWLRIQDRLNVFASKNQWPGKFEGRRGVWNKPLTDSQRADIEHALRWLLRRFVDPPWIDARLKSNGTTVAEGFRSPIDA